MSKQNLTKCELCPRRCGKDRAAGEQGACHASAELYLSRAALHLWEEPCLAGERGAGAVFFVGCNLGCVYCQNAVIAHGDGGIAITAERLSDIFLELAQQGAHTVDLVTPTHYAHLLPTAIEDARKRGLVLPIVYNCGGYESVETLAALEGYIDVYMPDFKYADPTLAARYSAASDYPEVVRAALAEMVRQCPRPEFDEDGIMRRGVLVRHLMLPGAYRNSHDVIKYLAEAYGDRIWLSIMNQYTPPEGIAERFPELAQPVRERDYRRLVAYAARLGITQAYVQEGGTVSESFIPAFDGEGVLPK